MQYFVTQDELLFYKNPTSFTKETELETLKYAIGANLYMPGTQKNIFCKLIHNKFREIGAITLCLEDAIKECEVAQAEKNILKILEELSLETKKFPELMEQLPLIFIRVRNLNEFQKFSKLLNQNHVTVLCGFCFPKFNSLNGDAYFQILNELIQEYNETLYGMPILEDRTVMRLDTRVKELTSIKDILLKHKKHVLNIRVGGTDFSSIFGLRRSVHTTIYDIHTVSDCLVSILNTFLPDEFVISGPVWEYFSNNPEDVEIKGLKKELRLDIQNGFHGKTIIHPSQINVVNREYVIKYHDYMDACDILKQPGGVSKGNRENRMNEAAPHQSWANKILAKAKIFGVLDKNAKISI